MAKNKQEVEEPSRQRQSRKDYLRERKQQEQLRTIYIGVGVVGVLLVAVILFALVNEFVISPQREVASVAGEKITLQEWQNRVTFERAQRIITLEDQLEMVNNDVGMVQQFSGQTINELRSYEDLGEAVLNSMARDKIIFQALEARGIEISEDEIDSRIAEAYNYFGGESPTPVPTPTDEPDPTPSVTPVGAEETEAVEEALPQPTSPPIPTATPVSEESFQQEFGDLMSRYNNFGVNEETYRTLVAGSVAAERLLEVLAEEQDLPEEDMQASAFVLSFSTEKEAQDALEEIEAADFLTVWNTIRSAPPITADADAEAVPPEAFEILWLTEDVISGGYGPEIAEAVFNGQVGEPSEIVEITAPDGSPAFVILMTSGMEVRPLAESELRSRKIGLLTEFLDEATINDVEIGEYWRSRVPTRPILDPLFLQPPTPTPALPEVPEVESSE